MAKRELITKEEARMAMTGIFDVDVSMDDYISSCHKHIDNIKPIIEQEIIKPYFDKLIAKMKERDEDNGGDPLNAIDQGYHLAFKHLCEEVDNLLSAT